jgi:Ca-activated chloride channel family protein
MFQFARPWLLLLLLAVPPLVWLWLRQRRGTLTFPDTGVFAALPRGRGRFARAGGASLRALVLVLLVLAMAGPQLADWRSRVPTEGIAITVILDVSGSMATRDFIWEDKAISRLEAAKLAMHTFVENRPNDLIGLVTFATRPESTCPLTLSHSVLLQLLKVEEPRSVPGESETNISDAIVLGLHRLESAHARRKVAVLLSDGEHNVRHPQSNWTPRQAAQIAGNLNIPIYTIDAGSDSGGEDYPGATPVDPALRAQQRASAERTLRSVASISGGRYFEARDTKTLLEVCKEIDRLEKQEIRSFQYERYYEGYPWFGLAAFMLLISLQVLEKTLWQRIP